MGRRCPCPGGLWNMFRSLLCRARSLPAVRRMGRWSQDLVFYRFAWEKDDVVFFSVFGFSMVLLGGLIYFAYADHIRIESDRQRRVDLTCLGRNIYFEARGEPIAGQYAVAEVTLNRVASEHFPGTVCEVVHEKRWDPRRKRHVGAFSWTELKSTPRPDGIPWQRALAAAEAVYENREAPRVAGALFYHASSVEPRWAKTKKQTAKIGKHIFYE